MRLLSLALLAALLPGAAAAAAHQTTQSRCAMALAPARGTGSANPHTLDRESAANAYFTVLRSREGCYQPILVSRAFRAPVQPRVHH